MAINYGKKFEAVIRQAFEKLHNVSIDRIHDQTTKYKGSQNICDFIVYREPYEFYFECKSIHGNTFPLSNITDTQYKGLLNKSQINGVFAGIIIWWIDKDTTKYIPIELIQALKREGVKSIRYDFTLFNKPLRDIPGKKLRTFFNYNMEEFLNEFV